MSTPKTEIEMIARDIRRRCMYCFLCGVSCGFSLATILWIIFLHG